MEYDSTLIVRQSMIIIETFIGKEMKSYFKW